MQTLSVLLNIPIWVPDLPGHGDAKEPQDFNIKCFVWHLLDDMDTIGIDLLDVFGYSMGGYVALVMAHIAR